MRPRTLGFRLQGLFRFVEAWYDEIDTQLEAGLNQSRLANLEEKVTSYLRDARLEQHMLHPSAALRRRFLEMCGIKRELRDDWDLFAEKSRCNVDGMPLGLWWAGVVGAFYGFHSDYVAGRPTTNWQDVRMQVKFLKMYSGATTK